LISSLSIFFGARTRRSIRTHSWLSRRLPEAQQLQCGVSRFDAGDEFYLGTADTPSASHMNFDGNKRMYISFSTLVYLAFVYLSHFQHRAPSNRDLEQEVRQLSPGSENAPMAHRRMDL
jgi:hypothetical protein